MGGIPFFFPFGACFGAAWTKGVGLTSAFRDPLPGWPSAIGAPLIGGVALVVVGSSAGGAPFGSGS